MGILQKPAEHQFADVTQQRRRKGEVFHAAQFEASTLAATAVVTECSHNAPGPRP